ncbi:homocysteine biosynthesis protein [Desulfoferrobacter suflitae]|uniref:homocysteine biosynthesis protein n=1 Tax=Desulfoferrobacter suflitae TaxID=2865782 RepID=UPI00216429B1|nr:homocysteine biosynthesis protein [Desulfoferrobacter suflitae]MCK8604251.1 homocysteine biosynthesis protein [Desulfoferrobacter suflitae]
MAKTIREINEKIKHGKAVVVDAEEVIEMVRQKGIKQAATEVDVVTTGTFAPMCSSGAYFNTGHSRPRIKLGGGRVTLNDVPAYTGFAAVDLFLGSTALPEDDPRNRIYPGKFAYGGAHVIEDLVAGKDVRLVAQAYGTDCYPRRGLDSWIRLEDMNEAVLFNMRNAYQNYNVAVNLSDRVIHTYMGLLQPGMRNATYCSAGQLSPLMNDPYYRTIGMGTAIFLGGGVGYIVGSGTQHNPTVPRGENGVPRMGAGTLCVMGNLKQMSSRWLRGASFTGYGTTLAVGIGVPIPILDEEVLRFASVQDADIFAQVVDYSEAYPNCNPISLGEVSYAQLKSGSISVRGKKVKTAGLSSYARAKEIATILREWILNGRFFLTESSVSLPSVDSGIQFRPLTERPVQNRATPMGLQRLGVDSSI